MFNEIYISGGKHAGFKIDIAEENIKRKAERTLKVKNPTEVVAELMKTLKLKPYHFEKIKKCYFEKKKNTGGYSAKL